MSKNSKKKDASSVLKMAVDILEEEIASGILAAKKMEKKVFNLDEKKAEEPSELMSRIRRDVHEAVDLMMDSMTVLVDYFGVLNEKVVRNENGHNNEGNGQSSAPVIKNDTPTSAGDKIDLTFQLTNDSADESKSVQLKKPELVNISGEKINPRNIRFSAPKFSLNPYASRRVTMGVSLPKSTRSGSYTGLIQDMNNPEIHVLVIINVM
jgi:hypothetical protein